MAKDQTPKTKPDVPKVKAGISAPENEAPTSQEATALEDVPAVEKTSPPPPKSTRLGMVVSLIVVLIGAGVVYFAQKSAAILYPGAAKAPAVVKTVPAAQVIGGPFSLTTHKGRSVTEKNFYGKYLLVTFGYTYCPDVCPTILSTMSDAMDLLGKRASQVTPIFITIDPERDTVEHLKEYVTYFHPKLVALTGSAEQIKAATRAYRVYYAKAKENKDDAEDYLMDHSSISYLMGPDGKFIAHFSHGTEAGAIARRINEHL